jgi:hypothetical protein
MTMIKRITRAWAVANSGFAMLGILWLVFWPFYFIGTLFVKPPDWW